MPVFASQGRDELREMWVEAWRKRRAGLPAEPLEAELADVAGEHPEYHDILEGDEGALHRDWTPEQGQSNPFLHMGLHVAVREGIVTDRPPGIAAIAQSLRTRLGSGHEAEHQLLECLAETLWEAQRAGLPPDQDTYLEKARQR
ncbi:MAG: DUF1841 family protein [Steroidobacteraceae bacterium]|nr:DUF1841 family protein [Steroidobacteraceae bacterium]MCC7200647.1 DUF1841 family protein [Gammaproteobacteria bacterium]